MREKWKQLYCYSIYNKLPQTGKIQRLHFRGPTFQNILLRSVLMSQRSWFIGMIVVFMSSHRALFPTRTYTT